MKDYKTYVDIKAEPEDVFTALTNPFTIELWSGEPAEMSLEEGSEFMLWGGDITGKNIEIVFNEKIVQQWYFEDDTAETPPSIVTMKIWPKKGFTSVELKHTNIPDEAWENIVDGWNNAYLGALKALLEI
jgi:uncharacterized protein YndB with AHSA1/START domain